MCHNTSRSDLSALLSSGESGGNIGREGRLEREGDGDADGCNGAGDGDGDWRYEDEDATAVLCFSGAATVNWVYANGVSVESDGERDRMGEGRRLLGVKGCSGDECVRM